MTFLEMRFPESISFNSSSIIEFNTTVIKTKNGSEQRNINWNFGKMKFNIINGIKTKIELSEILSFFRNTKGQAYGFRYKDWSDYKCENQVIAIGNGETNKFQLIKTYEISGNTYIRKITKPVISTISVAINGEINENFSVDLSTGIITFNEIPLINSTITSKFEFDVPVRFNDDLLEIKMDTINSGKIKDIILIEI